MAEVGANYLTLLDSYKRKDSKGMNTPIIEMMNQVSDVVNSFMAVECNEGRTHLTTVRAGLPTPVWTKLYQGVSPTKSITTQVRDSTGMLEDWIEVDNRLLDLEEDKSTFMMNESRAHYEAIAQELESTVFYGDISTDPEKFTGLAPRFSSLSAQNGNQIVTCGGAGSDNTSIWLVTSGPNACHLLYPKGTQAGLVRKVVGVETKENSSGELYEVFREHFMQHIGMSLRDWRYVVRLANIDVSDLSVDATTGADLIEKMTTAFYRHYGRKSPAGMTKWYCNTTVKEYLHHQAQNKTNVNLTIREVDGVPQVMMHGIPIVESEAILETEAAVS